MDKSLKYYLSGPMSSIEQHNIPAFDEAAAALRSQGFDIVSPAELDGGAFREVALRDSPDVGAGATCLGHTWGDLLSRDVKMIADDCGGIIFLPKWTQSKGALTEAYIGLVTGCAFGYYNKGNVTDYNRRSVAGVVASELTNKFNGT